MPWAQMQGVSWATYAGCPMFERNLSLAMLANRLDLLGRPASHGLTPPRDLGKVSNLSSSVMGGDYSRAETASDLLHLQTQTSFPDILSGKYTVPYTKVLDSAIALSAAGTGQVTVALIGRHVDSDVESAARKLGSELDGSGIEVSQCPSPASVICPWVTARRKWIELSLNESSDLPPRYRFPGRRHH